MMTLRLLMMMMMSTVSVLGLCMSVCSTIAWNLINSYYDDLPYPGASLMKANQPWSGYYEVGPPIWAAGMSHSHYHHQQHHEDEEHDINESYEFNII